MLADYSTGSLGEAEAAHVRSHLETCQACRAELASLERTGDLLNGTEPMQPGADLWPGIAAKLAPREPARQWWRVLLPNRRTWPAFAAAAAILLLVIVPMVGTRVSHGPMVAIPAAVDEEAPMFAQWYAEASLSNGASDPYALALALSERKAAAKEAEAL